MDKALKPLGFKEYFVYGLGNFASQLSWTMVGTYLSLFYTDVFGLTPMAVSLLMLVAKVWDGINDPMMGTLMERTHTKWGRFRPYIFIGAPLLVVFTVLTFTVPDFGGSASPAIWTACENASSRSARPRKLNKPGSGFPGS